MKKHFLSVVLMLFILMLGNMVIAQDDDLLTIYAGRNENLIAPILEQFTEQTGIAVEVLYGSTNSIATQILEEGDNSPADVFIAQDAGALGAVAKNDLLAELPTELLELSENPAFVSPDGVWIGLSGRARVLVYNPEMLADHNLELPKSLLDLTQPEWEGLVGWAPTNGSFQSNITAMRVVLGDAATTEWLEAMVENDTQLYQENTPIVQAVIDGEIVAGLVNHYYLFRFLAEDPDITAQLHFFPDGDVGSLVNVAGAGILKTTDQMAEAQTLLEFLLSEEAQTYFAQETFEYPLIAGVEPSVELPALSDIQTPDIDLTDLDDLQGTVDLIEASGALDG